MNFLEYRPRLEYKRKLEAILSDALEPNAKASERALKLSHRPSYTPSIEIKEAIDITPTDIYDHLHQAQDRLQQFIQILENSLKSKIANTMPIDEYIKAREENDNDKCRQFEDYHATNIEGLTQAEVLPILYQLQEENQHLINFTNQQFFNGKASIEQLAQLQKEEEQEIQQLVEEDRQKTIDLEKINEENHFKQYLKSKASQFFDFVESTEQVVLQTINEAYGGSVRAIISSVASAPTLVEDVKRIHSLRFETFAEKSIDAKNRMFRLFNPRAKRSLLNHIQEKKKHKLKNKELLKWMEQYQHEEKMTSFHSYLFDLIDTIDQDNERCNLLVVDLYKSIDLDRLQFEDYLSTLAEKKASRDTYHLLGNIQNEFNFNNKEIQQEVDRFVRYKKLEAPGSLY